MEIKWSPGDNFIYYGTDVFGEKEKTNFGKVLPSGRALLFDHVGGDSCPAPSIGDIPENAILLAHSQKKFPHRL